MDLNHAHMAVTTHQDLSFEWSWLSPARPCYTSLASPDRQNDTPLAIPMI